MQATTGVSEIVVGVLAVAVGLLACFAGHRAFRIVLPLLGFFVGFGLGAQVAASTLDQAYLESPLSWVIAIGVGLVVATIAYVWWYVSVVITIAALGNAIGFGAADGLRVEAAAVVGLVVAVLFGVRAAVLRVPIAIVIVVTAFWGASAVIGGGLLLLGRIDAADLRNGTVDLVIEGTPLLLAVWLALAVIGMAVQWVDSRREEAAGAGGI